MRWIDDLYGRHAGSDIYVVGTGPSLRVFPTGLLEDKITIGLNAAWRTLPVTYGITIHPDLHIPDFLEGEVPGPATTWITKRGKMKARGMSEDDLRHADEHFYYFNTEGQPNSQTDGRSDAGRILDWVRRPTPRSLYLWTSIAQSGVNLAANMGASNVVLVGCDNGSLSGNHHAHAQETLWLGASPEHRYHEYYEGLAEMRPLLRERGVEMVSMNPFLTIGPHEEDFARLCDELDLPDLLTAPDASDGYGPAKLSASEVARRRFRSLGRRWRYRRGVSGERR